ncbi:MAG: glycosyltransferase, partial [Anaerolineales bacterium]
MQILFLSRWFPYPPANGSKLRVYNLLRGLADHHDVTLLSFSDQPDVDSNTHALDSICRDAQVVQWEGFDTRSLRAHLGYLSLNPRSVVDTFSSELKQRLQQLLDTVDFDLIIASQIDMAGYSKYFGDVPALFDEVELGVLYEQFARAPSLWPRLRHALTWAKHRRYLASVLNNFLACTVVSDQEYQIITCAVRGYRSIEVIPNCVDLASYRGVRETHRSRNLIFTGSLSYYPNYEAMLWFLQKVYPRIQMNVLDVRLVITGNHGGRVLPPASNVDLTGFVDDVRPIISSSTISLVPLHTGGGTRLKILEAMALRTPV